MTGSKIQSRLSLKRCVSSWDWHHGHWTIIVRKKGIFSFAYLQFWILMVCNIYIVNGHVHHTSWLKTWCFVFYPIIFAKRFLPRNFPLSPPHHRHHHHPPVVAKCEQGVLILSYPWWTNSPLSVSIGMNNIAIWPSDKKIWHSVSVGSKCIFLGLKSQLLN